MDDTRRAGSGPGEGWVLVLDVGTSSVRAWFYDRKGEGHDPGPGATRPYRWRTTAAGSMECDPEELYASVASVIDAAVRSARTAEVRIDAVAIAAIWHSLLGVGADDAPVTPVFSWGDMRAASHALRLRGEHDERALHRRTGCSLHPLYSSVKLSWLREERPDLFRAAARWITLPEYIEWRLLGARRCSHSIASGTGLLDVHRLEWDAEALAIAGIDATKLSPLVDSGVGEGRLRPDLAARWPELRDAAWFPALGDGACANAGSGAVGLDRIGVTVGTTAAVRALWEPASTVDLPAGLWGYRLDRRRWVVGSALSNGGNGVAFLRRTLQLSREGDWEREVAALPPDAHGITVLPFLVGERGAGWLGEASAAMVGVTQSTTPAQIVRAWMEAITYRIGAIFDRLDGALGGGGEVLASGGALHASAVWAQMLADVIGREVTISTEPEATARGAALVALEALGVIPDVRAAPLRLEERYTPDPEHHARYRIAMRRQQEIAEALAPWLGPDDLPRPERQPKTLHNDA